MKKHLLIPFIALVTLPVYAQEVEIWSGVPVILDAYGHAISPDGTYSTGEAVSTDGAWARNNETGEVYFFQNASFGDGNHITKDKVAVGTDQSVMKGAFLLPSDASNVKIVPSLQNYYESFIYGINWDGTRIVGILSLGNGDMEEVDPDLQRMSYYPFYCDVDPETLTVSEPIFLPVPKRDFFGLVPQYCTATWISDDGTTVLGQVIDNTGAYIYPIIYKQASNGEWSYSLPSEKLFNPNGLEIPTYPQPAIKQPQAAEYIGNPEFKALFEELLTEYLSGNSTVNPYLMLDPDTAGSDALMTQEEWEAYSNDVDEYLQYFNTVYQQELDVYYDQYSKFIAQSTKFLQSSMAMNRAGSLIGQTKLVTRFSGIYPITFENPMIYDLQKDTWTTYGGDLSELEISQILPDGTLIAASPKPGPTSPDLTPQHSYACKPNSTEFIPLEDYIKSSNPEFYNWYMDYLYHDVPIGYEDVGENGEDGNIAYKTMTVSGLVAVSDDFTALSAGVDGWSWDFNAGQYFTYIFTGLKAPDTAVESLKSESITGYKVFNLQGVKVMDTKNAESLNTLRPGIYIINGKKVVI
ncbi:MAG: hypothetical protein J1F67_01005 [Muribaculaceae bacterium]|nr:hypothetical protein [Muribaculaceae bacterium]